MLRTPLLIVAPVFIGAALLGTPPARAAYPGANGELVFTSTLDGGARHIFAAPAGGPTDLTGATSRAYETQPKISPDGREILFVRQAPGLPNSEIFVMGADGSARSQLTATPTGNADPTWSPDGRSVAFVGLRGGGVPNIFVMHTDGTQLRQITHDPASKSQLAWAPRGDRIAFVRTPAGGGDREIYSIQTDGTGLTDLSNDPNNFDLGPAWSPDGAQIAYSGPFHPNRESVGGDVWIMNADGSNQHPLHHESNGYSDGAFPAWSPDGTTVAFVANNGTGHPGVWTVPAGGAQNTEVIDNTPPGGNPLDQEVDWGPAPASSSPTTRITNARIRARARTAAFTITATGAAIGYRCALRKGNRKVSFAACGSAKAYKHLKPGAYAFEAFAVAPGEPYRTATRKFKIP